MATVASNPHWQVDLQGTLRDDRCWHIRVSGRRVLRGLCPFLYLVGVKNNNTFFLVSLKQLVFVRFPLLLSRSSFPFSLYTPGTYLDCPSIQWFILYSSFLWEFIPSSQCKSVRQFRLILHGTRTKETSVKLENFRGSFSARFCEKLRF